jgi:NAD(P)-dependent dehydrogenase (short-subunit alcohol dehydrogenase family)
MSIDLSSSTAIVTGGGKGYGAGWSVYSAAKSGIVQFSKYLYTELREWE